MILIFSQQDDPSTCDVIDWLQYYGADYSRINIEQILEPQKLKVTIHISSEESFVIMTHNNKIINKPNAIWFRRTIHHYLPDNMFRIENHKFDKSRLRESFYNEYKISSLALYSFLEKDVVNLGTYNNSLLDKLSIIQKAKKVGIAIPKSIITNRKSEVISFLDICESLITKPIYEVAPVIEADGENTSIYVNYTEEISSLSVHALPDLFALSLFQEKLDKYIEIRVFYLNGKCHSMAIFSQLDVQTKVDFRKYSNNRNVPYKLPIEIEEKIDNLMHEIGLNTGSLDFILTQDNKYIFLEVNPNGQYGMTSKPCNYYLDREIAEFLTQKVN